MYIALIIVLIFFIGASLKIAQENERFAGFVMGRFSGFEGPGLVFAAPMIKRLVRLSVGDVGTLTSEEFASFGDVDVPVKNTASVKVGASVRIDGFDENGPRLAASAERLEQICPNCGHQY